MKRPPLPHQSQLDAIVEKLRAMTPQEIFELSVKSGIHFPDGRLRPEYMKEGRP